MQTYSVRDVERVLRLSRSTLRGLIKVGFVKPTRGRRRELQFSFQDLIVLRAARALIEAKVPRKRITRSLEDLRRHLPETLPLSGLTIGAVGDRIVVRDGQSHFQVDDGQYVLGFDVSVENGTLRVVERKPEPQVVHHAPLQSAEAWFERALQLEESDSDAAKQAYQQALALAPDHHASWVNLGRLLHERNALPEAEAIYRKGLEHCGPDPMLLFNLGVLLEDTSRPNAALEAYQAAITEDPNLADGHFNLARLYESLGKPQHAIRHLGQYRRLTNEAR